MKEYSLGVDTAPGAKKNSDLNSLAISSLTPIPRGKLNQYNPRELFVKEESYYLIRHELSIPLKNLKAPQVAAFIHMLHGVYNFSVIIMDPGGGGQWIYKHLPDKIQLIKGVKTNVQGICSVEDSAKYPSAEPILGFFTRGEYLLQNVWEKGYKRGDEGIKLQAFEEVKKMIENQSIKLCAKYDSKIHKNLPEQQAKWLKNTNEAIDQFSNIVQRTNDEGEALLSGRGYKLFDKQGGKTDGAMGIIYSLMGILSLIDGSGGNGDSDDEDLVY